MNRVVRFLRCNTPDRWLLLEALALLCWARILIRVVPFRWIAPHLGHPMAESPGAGVPESTTGGPGIVGGTLIGP